MVILLFAKTSQPVLNADANTQGRLSGCINDILCINNSNSFLNKPTPPFILNNFSTSGIHSGSLQMHILLITSRY